MKERVIKGEQWNRLYNPLIIEVFLEYQQRGGVLFGITGDLDNLGIYVARNGRPLAENLVDLYNQITRNFLERWTYANRPDIQTMAYVPSGEEVFIVGIAGNEDIAQVLFNQLQGGVMELMRKQQYIDLGETSTSFGGKVFGKDLDPMINNVVNTVRSDKSDEKVFPLYLELLSEIRRQTAIELDKKKFKDILEGKYPIEVRQLVLTRMLLYKRTTRQIVQSLNQLPRVDIIFMLGMLGDIYGIEPGKEDEVNNFINGITGRY
jgi:hypothetical protein